MEITLPRAVLKSNTGMTTQFATNRVCCGASAGLRFWFLETNREKNSVIFKNFLIGCLIFGSSLAYGGRPNIEEDPVAAYLSIFGHELGLGFEYRFSEQLGFHTEAVVHYWFEGLGTSLVYFPNKLNGWYIGIGPWYVKRSGLGAEDICYTSKNNIAAGCSPSFGTVPYRSIDTRIEIGWSTGEIVYFGIDARYYIKTYYLGPDSYPSDIIESDKRRYNSGLKNADDSIYGLVFNIGFRI